jgi:hypothetical protein
MITGMMLSKVKLAELKENSSYFIVRFILFNDSIERIDNVVGTYSGTVGVGGKELLRFTDIHRATRKSAMDLFSPETMLFYSIPPAIPREVFLSNILSFL